MHKRSTVRYCSTSRASPDCYSRTLCPGIPVISVAKGGTCKETRQIADVVSEGKDGCSGRLCATCSLLLLTVTSLLVKLDDSTTPLGMISICSEINVGLASHAVGAVCHGPVSEEDLRLGSSSSRGAGCSILLYLSCSVVKGKRLSVSVVLWC